MVRRDGDDQELAFAAGSLQVADVADVQQVIAVAIGGQTVTTTVEGRERYPVRVRYQRELRGELEDQPRG